KHIRSGYILSADTLAELAHKAGIDAAALEQTVQRFNVNAPQAVDPDFGRGGDAYDHSQGDPEHKPTANLGPIETVPFYALRLLPGDFGSLSGIRTDGNARVLGADDAPIPGL